jgi:hypothetical protein
MEMIRHEAETVNAKAFVLLTEMEVVDDFIPVFGPNENVNPADDS